MMNAGCYRLPSKKRAGFCVVGSLIGALLHVSCAHESVRTNSATTARVAASEAVNGASDGGLKSVAGGTPIPFARMTKFPEPGWQLPRAVQFSPDGAVLSYLHSMGQGPVMSLYRWSTRHENEELVPEPWVTGAQLLGSVPMGEGMALSREEELRRERSRQRAEGISEYRWAKHRAVLVVPQAGDVFVVDASPGPKGSSEAKSAAGVAGQVERLTHTSAPELDPQICDSGAAVAYVREGSLYVYDRLRKREQRIARAPHPHATVGLADYLSQEEFDEAHGFWWSPDCRSIAYLEVDESNVPEVRIMGFRGGQVDDSLMRYPRVGQRNAKVALYVARLTADGVRTSRLDWHDSSREVKGAAAAKDWAYLLRPVWVSSKSAQSEQHPDPLSEQAPDALWVWRLDRAQREADLLAFSLGGRAGMPSTIRPTQLQHLEVGQSKGWLELEAVRPLKSGKWLAVVPDDAGIRRLGLFNPGAKVGRPSVHWLTSGAWQVFDVVGVDEAGTRVWVLGNEGETLGRHLSQIDWRQIDSPQVKRLTTEPGVHAVSLSPTFLKEGKGFWVDTHSALDRRPASVVRNEHGDVVGRLPAPLDEDFATLRIRAPETVRLEASDGTELWGLLLKPEGFEPGRRYPAVTMVYGGPGVQTVRNEWSARLLWQRLAQEGYVVFQMDNRGTAGRGGQFEYPLYGALGSTELADQLQGLRYLQGLPFVASERIAAYGHSYGGFMVLNMMLRAPGAWKVGVAGSPVTDFRLYDSAYTERYMGLDPKPYEAIDLNADAAHLKGDLLLLHALMDENVHFEHTARMVDALVAADKPFELMVYPGERHGYRAPAARSFAYRRLFEFLRSKL